jgi:hypothetical protein
MSYSALANMFKRLSLDDIREDEEVLETTAIPGLRWIRNYYLRTSSRSRIVLQSPGQGNFTVVYHGSISPIHRTMVMNFTAFISDRWMC